MNNVILQAHELFKTGGFDYVICGGFGIEMHAGRELRTHGDFDIAVFIEDRQKVVQFLLDNDWPVYGRYGEAGPIWQYLFYKINDITDRYWNDLRNVWAVKPNCTPEMYKLERLQGGWLDAANPAFPCNRDVYSYKQPTEWLVQSLDFVEVAFDMRDGNDYVARENPRVTRSLDKAILYRDSIPYLAPEIILFYKADKYSSTNPYAKPRTEIDFKAIMPILSGESRQWLISALDAAYPDGYEWLENLLEVKQR